MNGVQDAARSYRRIRFHPAVWVIPKRSLTPIGRGWDSSGRALLVKKGMQTMQVPSRCRLCKVWINKSLQLNFWIQTGHSSIGTWTAFVWLYDMIPGATNSTLQHSSSLSELEAPDRIWTCKHAMSHKTLYEHLLRFCQYITEDIA